MTLRDRLLIASGVLAVASAFLLQQRRNLGAEQETLVAAIAAADSAESDARLLTELNRVRVQLEGARVRATTTTDPHLAISLSEGRLTLERGEIVLRSAEIESAVQRGVHTVLEVGPAGIILSDSVRIIPSSGADDTSEVAAGTIRLRRADFNAVLPNVRPGLMAYLF